MNFNNIGIDSEGKKDPNFELFPVNQFKKTFLKNLSAVKLTRDFSDFPFAIVPATEEEKKNCEAKNYIKFKTSYYTAWVHIIYAKYITPQHLENKNDTEGMRMARQYIWGRMNGKEAYQVAFNYRHEVQCIVDEYNELSNQEIRDNSKIYGKLGEEVLKIQDKYSLRSFVQKQLFQYQVWKQFAIIGMIFVSVILTMIYYSNRIYRK